MQDQNQISEVRNRESVMHPNHSVLAVRGPESNPSRGNQIAAGNPNGEQTEGPNQQAVANRNQ